MTRREILKMVTFATVITEGLAWFLYGLMSWTRQGGGPGISAAQFALCIGEGTGIGLMVAAALVFIVNRTFHD
jgi:hypothetical protein